MQTIKILHILPSNPGWNHFMMIDIENKNIVFFFTLYCHYFVLVDRNIFSLFKFFALHLSRDTLSVLAQGSHTVSLFAAMLMEQIWA
jgi:hypothetical protein